MFDIGPNRTERGSVDAVSFYRLFLTPFFIVISFLLIFLNFVNVYDKIVFLQRAL